MELKNLIRTVNYHIGGEEYCFITDGVPALKGDSMEEKMVFMRENYDHLRKAVMRAPRGNKDMFGGVITEPVSENGDCGIFYMGALTDSTYYPMCGSATVSLATMLVDTGKVPVSEPVTEITIDTPVGQVKSKVKIQDGKAGEVTYRNVPAFLSARGVEIETEAFGKFQADVGFGGGSFCVFVDEDEIGTKLSRDRIDEMVDPALEIIDRANDKLDIQHPENPNINSIDSCMYCGWHGDTAKELLVLGSGLVGRCPSGTGTPVRMIREMERGRVELGEEFVQTSMIDTSIKGKLIREVKVGGLTGYLSEVTGRSYMTGIHEWIIEEDDPLKEGYVL